MLFNDKEFDRRLYRLEANSQIMTLEGPQQLALLVESLINHLGLELIYKPSRDGRFVLRKRKGKVK